MKFSSSKVDLPLIVIRVLTISHLVQAAAYLLNIRTLVEKNCTQDTVANACDSARPSGPSNLPLSIDGYGYSRNMSLGLYDSFLFQMEFYLNARLESILYWRKMQLLRQIINTSYKFSARVFFIIRLVGMKVSK